MHRLVASIKKEFLVLIRDKAGLAILFIMPMVLVFIMSMIQDAPFRDYQEASIPMILVNEDQDSLGAVIERGLTESDIFEVHTFKNKELTLVEESVANGTHALGIVIPKGATQALRKKAEIRVSKTLEGLGLSEALDDSEIEQVEVLVFLDPATKKSFKGSVMNAIQQFTSKIENQIIITSFSKSLSEIVPDVDTSTPIEFEEKELITFTEVFAGQAEEISASSLNSVQHNVPAWTMFAMFFIVIPLAGHMIKERDQGSTLRLQLMPGSDWIVPAGKVLLYVCVCLVQFFLMLLVGLFLLPMFGLPMLDLGNNLIAMLLVAAASAFAATGFGIMVGTIFKTHQQAMSFGSVSVIILAALGGIWVPLYIMPPAMQAMGKISPLNWGLSGFNDVFLRGGGIESVVPEVSLLLIFFIITSLIAYTYNKMSYS